MIQERHERGAVLVDRDLLYAEIAAHSVGDTGAFVSAFGGNGVGRVMLRGATTTVAGRTVKIGLKKQALNGKLYYILTAFPGV